MCNQPESGGLMTAYTEQFEDGRRDADADIDAHAKSSIEFASHLQLLESALALPPAAQRSPEQSALLRAKRCAAYHEFVDEWQKSLLTVVWQLLNEFMSLLPYHQKQK
jgi:hypothetical protein